MEHTEDSTVSYNHFMLRGERFNFFNHNNYSTCKCAQLDVTIYRLILAIKNLYMFWAFLAHPQE
jgi:hypothetical protein